jgi:hypothetical protein
MTDFDRSLVNATTPVNAPDSVGGSNSCVDHWPFPRVDRYVGDSEEPPDSVANGASEKKVTRSPEGEA